MSGPHNPYYTDFRNKDLIYTKAREMISAMEPQPASTQDELFKEVCAHIHESYRYPHGQLNQAQLQIDIDKIRQAGQNLNIIAGFTGLAAHGGNLKEFKLKLFAAHFKKPDELFNMAQEAALKVATANMVLQELFKQADVTDADKIAAIKRDVYDAYYDNKPISLSPGDADIAARKTISTQTHKSHATNGERFSFWPASQLAANTAQEKAKHYFESYLQGKPLRFTTRDGQKFTLTQKKKKRELTAKEEANRKKQIAASKARQRKFGKGQSSPKPKNQGFVTPKIPPREKTHEELEAEFEEVAMLAPLACEMLNEALNKKPDEGGPTFLQLQAQHTQMMGFIQRRGVNLGSLGLRPHIHIEPVDLDKIDVSMPENTAELRKRVTALDKIQRDCDEAEKEIFEKRVVLETNIALMTAAEAELRSAFNTEFTAAVKDGNCTFQIWVDEHYDSKITISAQAFTDIQAETVEPDFVTKTLRILADHWEDANTVRSTIQAQGKMNLEQALAEEGSTAEESTTISNENGDEITFHQDPKTHKIVIDRIQNTAPVPMEAVG